MVWKSKVVLALKFHIRCQWHRFRLQPHPIADPERLKVWLKWCRRLWRISARLKVGWSKPIKCGTGQVQARHPQATARAWSLLFAFLLATKEVTPWPLLCHSLRDLLNLAKTCLRQVNSCLRGAWPQKATAGMLKKLKLRPSCCRSPYSRRCL